MFVIEKSFLSKLRNIYARTRAKKEEKGIVSNGVA